MHTDAAARSMCSGPLVVVRLRFGSANQSQADAVVGMHLGTRHMKMVMRAKRCATYPPHTVQFERLERIGVRAGEDGRRRHGAAERVKQEKLRFVRGVTLHAPALVFLPMSLKKRYREC